MTRLGRMTRRLLATLAVAAIALAGAQFAPAAAHAADAGPGYDYQGDPHSHLGGYLDPDGSVWSALHELTRYDGRDVLDLGCGTGFHLPRFASTARRVIGVEPHPSLAALAGRRTRRLGNVEVVAGQAESLPVPDSSVDVVHARWAYFFGPGSEPGLAELDRVMRRGGTAVVIDNDPTTSTFGSWFREGFPDVRTPHREVVLGLRAGDTTVVELASRFDRSPQAVSKTLTLLEGSRYVTRGRDPGDGRVRPLFLTERGEALVEALRRARRAESRELTRWLGTRDRAELVRLLRHAAEQLPKAHVERHDRSGSGVRRLVQPHLMRGLVRTKRPAPIVGAPKSCGVVVDLDVQVGGWREETKAVQPGRRDAGETPSDAHRALHVARHARVDEHAPADTLDAAGGHALDEAVDRQILGPNALQR